MYGVHIYSSNLYGNAMVQRLSAGLAQQIVITESLLDNRGQVNHRTLKSLFERLMTLNPVWSCILSRRKVGCLWRPPSESYQTSDQYAPLKNFSPVLSGPYMVMIPEV